MEDVSALCSKCHKDVNVGLGSSKYSHRPAADGRCIVCHMPHGSKIKGSLPRPLNELCFSCHTDFEKGLKEKGLFVHKPVADGDCDKCHLPHFSMERGLLREKGDQLCNDCHKDQDSPTFKMAHGDIPVRGSDCLGCHEPHAGADRRLLHKVMHAPLRRRIVMDVIKNISQDE